MKTFRWCDIDAAKDCSLSEEHVHICINSPKGRTINPRCGRPALHLFFHDLYPEQIRKSDAFADNPVKGQEYIDNCMHPEQAQRIVDFVKHTDDKLTVMVNCEAGISRSPGVVLAMRKHYGGDTDEVFKRAYPNLYVTNMVTEALNNVKT